MKRAQPHEIRTCLAQLDVITHDLDDVGRSANLIGLGHEVGVRAERLGISTL